MSVDVIALEVVRNRLARIAEDMGVVLRNTAFSPNIKERLDCSAAVFTADGEELFTHDQAALFVMRALARLERDDPRRRSLLASLGDAHAGAGRLEAAVEAWKEKIQNGSM